MTVWDGIFVGFAAVQVLAVAGLLAGVVRLLRTVDEASAHCAPAISAARALQGRITGRATAIAGLAQGLGTRVRHTRGVLAARCARTRQLTREVLQGAPEVRASGKEAARAARNAMGETTGRVIGAAGIARSVRGVARAARAAQECARDPKSR